MLARITPTDAYLARLDAALAQLEDSADRELRHATAAGDVDARKLAQNHVNAYRKARWHAQQAECWRVAPNGDLLIRSSRSSVVYTVRQLPRDGDGYSPIVCPCEHGQKAAALGICYHIGLYHGLEATALDDATVEAEIAPAPAIAGIIATVTDDPAYLDALLADEPGVDAWLDYQRAIARGENASWAPDWLLEIERENGRF